MSSVHVAIIIPKDDASVMQCRDFSINRSRGKFRGSNAGNAAHLLAQNLFLSKAGDRSPGTISKLLDLGPPSTP